MLLWSAVHIRCKAEAPIVSCFHFLIGACMLLQTLAGCSRHWCNCPRPCPAHALGPSPGEHPGPGAPLRQARQCLALLRRGALLGCSWRTERSRHSCSMETRTGLPQMRAPLLRLQSALAGKALMYQTIASELHCSSAEVYGHGLPVHAFSKAFRRLELGESHFLAGLCTLYSNSIKPAPEMVDSPFMR